MRKLLKFAGLAVAAAIIAGCNPPTQATQQQTACNCHGTVTTANPYAETQRFVTPGGAMHRHHRTHYASGGYDERRSYRHRDGTAERSYARSNYDDASYSYRSTSHVYYEDGQSHDGSGNAYSGGDNDGFVDASDHGGDRWQDGYGRWHNRAALGAKATRTRLDPWHGYDVDCPHGTRHHRH